MSYLPITDPAAKAATTSTPQAAAVAAPFSWKLWGVLLAAGLAGVLAILPMAFDMVELMQLPVDQPPMPVWLIALLSMAQNTILLGGAIASGLVLCHRLGLPGPVLLRDWLSGRRPGAQGIVIAGISGGLLAGALMVIAEAFLFARHLPAEMLPLMEIPLWKRLLAGVLYGGVTEELLMRLCLVPVVAWLLLLVWRNPSARGTVLIAAVAIVAVLFGLGHLPATAALTDLTPLLVTRALVLNGIAGLVCGLLFLRRGLESAMLAHAVVHLVLQLPGVWLVLRLAQG